MTSSSPPVAERLREYLKIKYMTPSKITGETYQMVPPELIEEARDALIALQSERDEANRQWRNYEAAARDVANERDALRASLSRKGE